MRESRRRRRALCKVKCVHMQPLSREYTFDDGGDVVRFAENFKLRLDRTYGTRIYRVRIYNNTYNTYYYYNVCVGREFCAASTTCYNILVKPKRQRCPPASSRVIYVRRVYKLTHTIIMHNAIYTR